MCRDVKVAVLLEDGVCGQNLSIKIKHKPI